MTILFRYLFTQVVIGIALAASIVTVMIIMIDYVEVGRTITPRSDASWLDVLGLVLLRAPMLIESTLPFVVLFGVIWAMFRLNRRSELTVMRASGVSAWRFIAPGAVVAGLIGVLATTVYNPTAARLNDQYKAREASLLSGDPVADMDVSSRGLWLREARRDGHFIVRARGSQDEGSRLSGVTIYAFEFAPNGAPVFQRRIDAASAVLRAGFWELTEARETGPAIAPIIHDLLSVPTELSSTDISQTVAEPGTIGFWRLRSQAAALSGAGFNAAPYLLRWWELAAATLSLVAMAVIASATALRLNRRGGAFFLAVLGVAIGFAVYFANSMTSALALTGALPPWAAASAAPLLALLGGVYAVSVLEDG